MNVRVVVVGLGLGLGCGPGVGLSEDDGSSSAASGGPTSASSTGMSQSGTSGLTSSSADSVADGEDTFDSSAFIDCGGAAPPGSSFHCIGVPEDCDPLQQNCSSGLKCNPWSSDGGDGWDSTHCVPVDDRPVGVGEACTITGSPWSGLDDCEPGSFCVPQDAASLVGVCWALCSAGLDGAQECEAGACVVQPGDLALPVCEPACDPVAQDCPAGPCDAGREPFGCVPAVGPGNGLGEVCSGLGDCVAGTTCYDGAAVPDCAGMECCAAFCDLQAPEPALECEGLECQEWFPLGMAPAGYEHVGVCVAGPLR